MAYVYKITNTINNKLYIGKTVNTIEKRFNQHKNESKTERAKNRPLYRAINKYGIENFEIEIIEECNYDILNEREIYWINYYDTYNNGYNATLGGDGTIIIDYKKVLDMWNKNNNITVKQIAEFMGHDIGVISRILKEHNITKEEIIKRGQDSYSYKVAQLDKDTGEIIAVYDSQQKAAVALGKTPTCGANIGRVCNGQRPTAYGYKWKRI